VLYGILIVIDFIVYMCVCVGALVCVTQLRPYKYIVIKQNSLYYYVFIYYCSSLFAVGMNSWPTTSWTYPNWSWSSIASK
jgi:hypothetical protein